MLWKEVRRQRGKRGGFAGPKIARLESSPDHFAHGFTARDATSFQGQHEEHVLIIFDEAVGVGREFWEAAETMLQGERCSFLAIYNPTDTSSYAYIDEQLDTGYRDIDGTEVNASRSLVVEIPATLHPNIIRELRREPPKYPKAIRLAWLNERIQKWCERIDARDGKPTDLEWPPGSGVWYRPGPLAQARLLARWPTASDGVWGDALWGAAVGCQRSWAVTDFPEIGCDVARFGDDWTCIVVRVGPVVMSYEEHNGWGTDETAGRLKELAREWARWKTAQGHPNADPVSPRMVTIKVDDDGVGGGVVDQLKDGFTAVGVNSLGRASDRESYPNRRSELWFALTERARAGELNLGRLPLWVLAELKRQAMAPKWKLNGQGQRVVEPKDDTKEKLGRSPDGMDALNLAFCRRGTVLPPSPPPPPPPAVNPGASRPIVPTAEDWAGRRGMMGMGG